MTEPAYLNTSHQTIAWIAKMHKDKLLEISPPFQRRPVWNDEAKAYFVDTILRGMPVPEIYVQSLDLEGDDGELQKVQIVDGQQRIRAILEFLDDGFDVSFDPSKMAPVLTLAETPWYGKTFSELSPEERKTFRRYKLIVRDLEEVDEDHIRHMFSRLNQSNVSLNAQELRYSMYPGGLLDTVEDLVKRGEWQHFRIFTTNQRRRMLDSEFVSELVIGYLHGLQNKKQELDKYYIQYSTSFPFEDEVSKSFGDVLEYLIDVFPMPKMAPSRWYRKSDFYTLFLALVREKIPFTPPNEVKPRGRANYEAEVEALRQRLIEFSSLVGDDEPHPENSPVEVYRHAVERAATDRSRRVHRERALLAFLDGDREVKTLEDNPLQDSETSDEDDTYLDDDD